LTKLEKVIFQMYTAQGKWLYCICDASAVQQYLHMRKWKACSTLILQLSLDQHYFLGIQSHRIQCATTGQKNPHYK